MKVLLTGASGFVGSHVLDRLRARSIPVALLLREHSPRRFIADHMPPPEGQRFPEVEVRIGSISDPSSLGPAMAGITHVLHCAGSTKAAARQGFYDVNRDGTRHLVAAANATPGLVRFIHVSSLAAAGPALPDQPAREADAPHPVSDYGQSKLAGELEVRQGLRADYVIIRPPAVYGPRDAEFLRLFTALKRHVAPRPGPQPLSLVYVHDLADALVRCLDHPAVVRKTYYVAAREIVTARELAGHVAAQMGTWALPLPLPTPMFWPICLAQELLTRLTGKANVLSLQKYAELRAPGWVCDPGAFQADTGYACPTSLGAGIAVTLGWYRQNGWL